MVIKFDITDLKVDLTHISIEPATKDWWFRNAKISVDKNIEDLTEEDKINIVKLAIYEGYITIEELCNLPNNQFKIKV